MQIQNKTRNTILANDAYETRTVREKTLGLLDGEKPRSLILHTHFGIHTFGMKTPIDILILSNRHAVVALKQSLQPNRIYLWNTRYSLVIELPEGTILKTKTEIGDEISLNSKL